MWLVRWAGHVARMQKTGSPAGCSPGLGCQQQAHRSSRDDLGLHSKSLNEAFTERGPPITHIARKQVLWNTRSLRNRSSCRHQLSLSYLVAWSSTVLRRPCGCPFPRDGSVCWIYIRKWSKQDAFNFFKIFFNVFLLFFNTFSLFFWYYLVKYFSFNCSTRACFVKLCQGLLGMAG